MVRTVIADESFLTYLKTFNKPETCTVGLILGQSTGGKDFIIHLAKTPLGQCETAAKKSITPSKPVKQLSEVSESLIADHAKQATRMLPGGIFVLGIFVVSEEDIFSLVDSKLILILNKVRKQLTSNPFIYGNQSSNDDKLVLNLCTKTQSYSCKNYDFSYFKPAEIKFQAKIVTKWLKLDCKYELDQIFPILKKDTGWPLRKYMTTILEKIDKNLQNAVFIIDGEIKDGDENMESVGKKRKVSRSKTGYHENQDSRTLQVTICEPCNAPEFTDPKITNCGGKIRLKGHVASKVWLNPKATVGMASEAIVQDIVRSLAARLEMHWDSLIEEEHGSPEDTNSIHEPPRRVLVTLPSSKITFSDYLFPGEGLQESQVSLQELLDITITSDNLIEDIEGQADLNEMYMEEVESADEVLSKLPTDTNRFMYLVGLGLAFLVLIISLVIHYFKNYS